MVACLAELWKSIFYLLQQNALFKQDINTANYAMSTLQGTRLLDQSIMRIEFARTLPEINGM